MNIYFGTMDISTVEELPEYLFYDFINSLGGALSLLLGVSIIMLFEWVEFFLRFMYSLLNFLCVTGHNWQRNIKVEKKYYYLLTTSVRRGTQLNETPIGILPHSAENKPNLLYYSTLQLQK